MDVLCYANIEDLRLNQILGLGTPQVTTGLLPDSRHTAGHYHMHDCP